MAQSISQQFAHIVFSTKHRQPLIIPEIRNELYSYMGGILKNIDCHSIQIGGIADHVHILCGMSKKMATIDILEEVKRSSSRWIKTQNSQFSSFYWQDGYGAFSVGYTQIPAVVKYIQNQEMHHAKNDFQKEYLLFLKKYQVEYNEKYIWD